MWLFPSTMQGRGAILSAPGCGPTDLPMRLHPFPSTEAGFHKASWRSGGPAQPLTPLQEPVPHSPACSVPICGGCCKGDGDSPWSHHLCGNRKVRGLWLVSTGTGCFGQKANRRPMLTQKHAALLASAAGALMVHLKAGVPSA